MLEANLEIGVGARFNQPILNAAERRGCSGDRPDVGGQLCKQAAAARLASLDDIAYGLQIMVFCRHTLRLSGE